MLGITCHKPASELFAEYCRSHELPDEHGTLDVLNEPYTGCATSSIYRGMLGDNPVQVKVWRGCCQGADLSKDFTLKLVNALDNWKRAFDHPNIVQFLGVIDGPQWECLPSLVTPLNPININAYLRSKPEAKVLPLIYDVADALAYMHSLDPPVVHGDVRGENIVVTENGKACLTELGLKHLPFSQGMTVGLNEYFYIRWWAPEIIDPPQELQGYWNVTTPQSDVYSFAFMMLELFTGKVPWYHLKYDARVISAVVEGKKTQASGE